MKKTCLVLLTIFCTSQLLASEVWLEKIDIQSIDNKLLINPQFSLNVEKPIEEAINNGIVITLIIKIKSVQNVDWWFNKTIESQKQTFEIRYFSLSGQYQLKNIDNNIQDSFVTLNELWNNLAKNSQFSLQKQITDVDYVASRFILDTGALPSTMQLPVIFSSAWDINSDWQNEAIKSSTTKADSTNE